MTGPGDTKSAEMAGLWRRFRALDRGVTPGDGADDWALELAAYAEGRLDEAAAERIEAWLLAHPEALDDVIAARAGAETAAPHDAIERAAVLVSDKTADARVIPFRRPAAPAYAWRVHVARVAVAASLVLTGLIGFTLGTESYSNLFGSSESTIGGLFEQSVGVFTGEDSAT